MDYDILYLIDQHEATGRSQLLEDKVIAARLSVPLLDVQRELENLEDLELVKIAKTFGPTYDVELTPKGRRALRAAAEETRPAARPIGF